MSHFRMNPLPRFVAIMLFVVLTALVALLAVPVWRGLRAAERSGRAVALEAAGTNEQAHNAASTRMIVLSQRVALFLAASGLALTVTLILGHTLRPIGSAESRASFDRTRT